LGFEDTVSNGLISAIRQMDADFQLLQISAPIDHGSSGGPIIADDGTVVGVSVAGIEGGHDLNFAVPVGYLHALLAKPGKHAFSELPSAEKRNTQSNDARLRSCGSAYRALRHSSRQSRRRLVRGGGA